MKRFIAPLVLVLAIVGLVPAAKAATVTCPGVPGIPLTNMYDFRGNLQDTLHPNDPDYTLRPLKNYPMPTVGTESVLFKDDTVLVTNGNVFSPGTSDFVYCIKVSVSASEDGNNLTQIGNSHEVSPIGMIKLCCTYGQYNTDQFRAKVTNGLTGLAGKGYHVIGLTRIGNTFCAWADGIKSQCKTYQGTFRVDLNQQLAIGGKIEYPEGSPVHTSDMCQCYVAYVYMGKS